MPPISIIGAGLALMLAIVLVTQYREKQRAAALKDLSAKIGFTYAGGSSEAPLLSSHKPDDITNVMRGSASGFEVLLYDYHYHVGTGGRRQHVRQTIAAFKLPATLPAFELRPENVLHKIGSAFGYQDIDFDSNPEFSDRYLLRGDEVRVRRLFTPALMTFFERLDTEWSVETSGSWLMAYRSRKRVQPEAEAFRDFILKTSWIAAAVRKAL